MLSFVDKKVIKSISRILDIDKEYIKNLYMKKIMKDCLSYISYFYGDLKPEKRFNDYTENEKFELIEKTYKVKINYENRDNFIREVNGFNFFSRTK